MAIFKTRNGESGNGNGARGTGNLSNGESLKVGIFKTGNLKKRLKAKSGNF